LPERFSDLIFKTLKNETHKNNIVTPVHAETLHDAMFSLDYRAKNFNACLIDSLIYDSELAN
jgi:hypothetical protein